MPGTSLKKCLALLICICAFSASAAFAEGELTLRVMAINPSKDQTQKAEIKAYLPKEIRLEDILEKGDLEVAYDNQQGAYFVHGLYDLKPGQTIEREIQIRDVWRISSEELESVRSEVQQTAALLTNTDFQERAAFLKAVIDTKVSKILERQKVLAASPDKHISNYRENLELMESIKQDLLLARSLLAQAKPKRQLGVVWKLFFGVVVFLGLLGLSFYVIWHRQLKTIGVPAAAEPSSLEPDLREGEQRQATERKPISPDDIQKIIQDG